jgi:hypothetical protein
MLPQNDLAGFGNKNVKLQKNHHPSIFVATFWTKDRI